MFGQVWEGVALYETLIVERRGRVGWLIFNRPDSLNANNLKMTNELSRAWVELDNDDDVSVIVNTGRGRGFSVGADVKEIAATGGGMGDRLASGGRRPHADRNEMPYTPRSAGVRKPLICAVNGVCAGAGMHFVADADIVIASSNASFTDAHVTVGQVAALEPIGLLSTMPFGWIMRMALVGSYERLSAERACMLGLVTEVIDPPEDLEAAAQELGELIAKNSPRALMLTKEAIWNGREMGRDAAQEMGLRLVEKMWSHPDNAEGPAAFTQKRAPVWGKPGSVT